MFIRMADDERRFPVPVKSKVMTGGITAASVGGRYWPAIK